VLTKKISQNIIFWGLIVIPLEPSIWKQISFGRVPIHELSLDQGLKISVNQSASALVYKFDQPQRIAEVEIELTQVGEINYQGKKIGEKGADDFPLRLGFVMSGEKRLSWGQGLIAPKWVKELYTLAPKERGLDRVSYLVIAQEKPLYTKRFHPFSELLEEEIVGVVEKGVFKATLRAPQGEVLGLWVSSDGDDTKSRFTMTINRLILKIQD
jgi:hypothetical protein